jgi:hypothetical protein
MKTSNLIVLSEEDLQTFKEYNAATPEQKALIWVICEKKMPDLLMWNFWDYLELCIAKGLEEETD